MDHYHVLQILEGFAQVNFLRAKATPAYQETFLKFASQF